MRLKYVKVLLTISALVATLVYAQEQGFSQRIIHKNEHMIYAVAIDPKFYNIVIVQSDPTAKLDTVFSLAKHYGAKAAINAGFFAQTDQGERVPAGALKIKGEWIHAPVIPRAALAWGNNTEVLIDRVVSKDAWQVFDNVVGGVPLLIKSGKKVQDYSPEKARSTFLNERHARTAVCIKPDRTWEWFVISHTKTEDRAHVRRTVEGFTIAELSDFLMEQHCQDAINLDGGGSSTLVIGDRVVNWPAGDRHGNTHRYHLRPVSDAILALPKSI